MASDKMLRSALLDLLSKVWNELRSKDVRDVIKVARLAPNAEDIPFVIKMLKGQNKQILLMNKGELRK